jgi:hypothetical protein
MSHPHCLDRRAFIALLASTVAPLVTVASAVARPVRVSGRPVHPDPRPGIDGSRVLEADEVGARLAELYDAVRVIPEVVDGIRCTCGCADVPGMYSLLSCYEESGMAQYCTICQGEGRLVTRLHAEGRTLSEIRAEIDRRFG